MIIYRFSELTRVFDDLGPGDLFVGRIPSSHLTSALLVDLVERGVRLLPAATAQMLSASKAAQAQLLRRWMPPHTRVIQRRRDLLDAVGAYQRSGIAAAVTKAAHLHCGQGVHRWDNLEAMYNVLTLHDTAYPLVLQPFLEIERDLRVIVVGRYREAYERFNPAGFRRNLAAGGESRPCALTAAQQELCTAVMERARMPYAHLDLIVTGEGELYLSELSLGGGLHGARIRDRELEQLKRDRLAELAGDPEAARRAV